MCVATGIGTSAQHLSLLVKGITATMNRHHYKKMTRENVVLVSVWRNWKLGILLVGVQNDVAVMQTAPFFQQIKRRVAICSYNHIFD